MKNEMMTEPRKRPGYSVPNAYTNTAQATPFHTDMNTRRRVRATSVGHEHPRIKPAKERDDETMAYGSDIPGHGKRTVKQPQHIH